MHLIDISGWPLVLCGPILRRVDRDSVSVFVALRFRRSVTMSVFACDNHGVPLAPYLGQNTIETRHFGKRLHVAVITVSGLTLQPLQLYAYDLLFKKIASDDSEDTNTVDSSLQSLGLLNGETPLGYEKNLKPTFRMPSDQANSLEFIHASCRKLHGEGIDAFPHIDEVIKGLRLDEFKRPQMMFLTGDQIYADDVAGPLSPILTKIGNALLGWTEEESIPTLYGNTPISTCWPGLRSLIVNQAGFKAEDKPSACHLLGLGEYYAMYLMAWSDAIWPTNLPDPKLIYPSEVFEGGGGSHTPFGGTDSSSIYQAILDHAKAFIGNGARWSAQMDKLVQIKASLPAVRRLMANVPIYMMFDDHEVTDDWNFDRDWYARVYGNALGRRIIGNGLSAYAIFQGWGNDPLGEFAPNNPGGQLLSALETISNRDGTTYKEGDSQYDLVHSLTRITPSSSSEGVTWDYGFERKDYRMIALDTRTRRVITQGGQADLMSPNELDRQITARVTMAKILTLIVSPAPVIGHPFHERVIVGVGGKICPKYLDREPWLNEGRPEAFEGLLDRLSQLERVVILTGDVHFGSTSSIRYWNERPEKQMTAVIGQLLSSALNNEDWATRGLGAAGTASQKRMLQGSGTLISVGGTLPAIAGSLIGNALPDALIPPEREDYIGWASGPVNVTKADGNSHPILTKPPVYRLTMKDGLVADKVPEWRYRLSFATDLRNQRGYQLAAPEVKPVNESFLARKKRLGQELRVTGNNNRDLIVVGHNNFGKVSILGEPPHLGLMHQFWFRPEGQPILPYTTHFLDLDNPDSSEIPPFTPEPVAAGLPDLLAWADLMNFRPESTQQNKLLQLNIQDPEKWFFHRLESGWGQINLDYYAVQINQMPTSLPGDLPGTQRTTPVTIEELFQFVRHNLLTKDAVVNSFFTEFRPYGPLDETVWHSTASDALGALISIRIPGNEGTVMATQSESTSWIFSTVNSPNDGSHPVSGNRRFGVFLADDEKIYVYTMGADRCTDRLIATTPAVEIVWTGADQTWKSFQSKITDLIKNHGGIANAMQPISRRYDWPYIMSSYFSPKDNWLR